LGYSSAVEQSAVNRSVAGSNPAIPAIHICEVIAMYNRRREEEERRRRRQQRNTSSSSSSYLTQETINTYTYDYQESYSNDSCSNDYSGDSCGSDW
jgi:hypothetical protein